RALLAALLGHFVAGVIPTNHEAAVAISGGVDAWNRNVERAHLRLAGERQRRPSFGLSVAGALRWLSAGIAVHGRRHYPVCEYCHTPLMLSYYVGGRLVTRRKEWCDETCKGRWQRGGRAKLRC